MRDAAGFAAIILLAVLIGLLVSVIDSCRGYEECLKRHSIKTCKEHFGKDTEPDDLPY